MFLRISFSKASDLFLFCWEAAWVCPGRSALQSAAQGETKTLRPFRHIDVIIKTEEAQNKLIKTCNQARINLQVQQVIPLSEKEESFGENPKVSTCAGAGMHRRELW